jgi:CheY-like chemotaxis protein
MTQAAMDGGETVRRLLAFARPQQRRESARVDIGDLLREVEKLTAPRWRDAAQARGRPIGLRTEAEDGAVVLGDPSSLREALTNLVFNAIDAMPDGGDIRLAARRRDQRVEIQVADSGVGMSDAVKARIFDPFFTTKGERGSGLGLSMVFGIVRRHGGDIVVESAQGRGTTFRVSLPAGGEPRADAPVVAERAIVARRILVVDDELRLATMAAKLLSLDGHATVVATSGEEALDHLARESIDLVLTDLGLGEGMNGWDVADRVRHRWPGLPVILLTGWGADIDEAEARARGVAMVLAKPYRPSDLRRALAMIDERP